jgi:hypothetical protein
MNIEEVPYRDTWIPVGHINDFKGSLYENEFNDGVIRVESTRNSYKTIFKFDGEELELQNEMFHDFLCVWIGNCEPWTLEAIDFSGYNFSAHDTHNLPVSVVAMSSDAIDIPHFKGIHKLYDIDCKSDYDGHKSYLEMTSSNADLTRPIFSKVVSVIQKRFDGGVRTATEAHGQGLFIFTNDIKPLNLGFSLLNVYMVIPRGKNSLEIHNLYYFSPLSIKLLPKFVVNNINKNIESELLEGYRKSLAADFPYWEAKSNNLQKYMRKDEYHDFFSWISAYCSKDVIDFPLETIKAA